MAASYACTCYLIDVSPSMGETVNFDGIEQTKLQHALEFVRIKIAQRLINPKKTDQIAVVLFGGKTQNQLAEDKEGYDHIEEIQIGKHDADTVAAIYVAGNVARTATVRRKDSKKSVILLTDADEHDAGTTTSATDWQDEDWTSPLIDAVVPGKHGGAINWRDLFTLGIIGTDFGNAELEEQTKSSWSPVKKRNVEALHALSDEINRQCLASGHNPRALIDGLGSATQGAGGPVISPINTQHKHVELTIGDVDVARDESLSFKVEIQKATQKAAAKSMGQMRRGAWTKSLADTTGSVGNKKRRRDPDVHEDVEEEEDRESLHGAGAIVAEKQYFYYPDYNKEDTKSRNGNGKHDHDDDDEDDEEDRFKRSEASRMLDNVDNLSRAYKYGADLIPISKEEEDDFYQFPAGEPGIEVRGFTKAADYRPELILGDPRWVFGGADNQSQIMFSALLWAMHESRTYALVRLLLPKESQPRLHLLVPLVGPDAVDEIAECGLLLGLPFKEEVANWAFPSLDRIHTVSGRPVTEHRLLPKKELLEAMDGFVDAMMLPNIIEGDSEGEISADGGEEAGTPWFDPRLSYNPAIHNMRNFIIAKLLHPDISIANSDLPPHPLIAQYMYPPDEVLNFADAAAMALQKSAKLTEVPPKPKATRGRYKRKRGEKPTTNPLDDILGIQTSVPDKDDNDVGATQGGMFSQSQGLYRQNSSMRSASQKTSPNGKGEGKSSQTQLRHQMDDNDDSATEDSDSKDGRSGANSDATMSELDVAPASAPATSLLSEDDPLDNFEQLIQQAGMITRAERQLLEMIDRLVTKARTKTDIALPVECLQRARDVAIQEDEVDVFNEFLFKYKHKFSDGGTAQQQFIDVLKEEKVTLVSDDEGGGDLMGTVNAEAAAKFWT